MAVIYVGNCLYFSTSVLAETLFLLFLLRLEIFQCCLEFLAKHFPLLKYSDVLNPNLKLMKCVIFNGLNLRPCDSIQADGMAVVAKRNFFFTTLQKLLSK